jgi:hypothetical protein
MRGLQAVGVCPRFSLVRYRALRGETSFHASKGESDPIAREVSARITNHESRVTASIHCRHPGDWRSGLRAAAGRFFGHREGGDFILWHRNGSHEGDLARRVRVEDGYA